MKDSFYKKIMKDLGMPQSKSLYNALLKVANEAIQETRGGVVESLSSKNSKIENENFKLKYDLEILRKENHELKGLIAEAMGILDATSPPPLDTTKNK